MASREFAAFVAEQNQTDAGSASDRAGRVSAWRSHLTALQDRVRDYLRPFVEAGTIALETLPVSLNEELLGAYEADKLLIHIGSKVAVLEPVSSSVIGASGRVDLLGPRDERKIVLVPRDVRRVTFRLVSEDEQSRERQRNAELAPLTWKIVPGPRQDLVDLTEDSFTAAIMDVTR